MSGIEFRIVENDSAQEMVNLITAMSQPTYEGGAWMLHTYQKCICHVRTDDPAKDSIYETFSALLIRQKGTLIVPRPV